MSGFSMSGVLFAVIVTSAGEMAWADEPEPITEEALPAAAEEEPTAGGSASAEVVRASPAAQPDVDEGPPWHKGRSGIVIALKLGVAIPSAFNDFEPAFTPELELGYVLPFAGHMLEVFASGRWAAPESSGETGPDARLPGDGMMRWHLRQQTAAIGLGLRVRFDVGSLISPYVAAGGRVSLMRSEVTGEAGGEPFGDNEETSVRWGFFGTAGAELHVGPGAILLEVQVNQLSMDAWVLRDTNISSLDIFAGYRFMF